MMLEVSVTGLARSWRIRGKRGAMEGWSVGKRMKDGNQLTLLRQDVRD